MATICALFVFSGSVSAVWVRPYNYTVDLSTIINNYGGAGSIANSSYQCTGTDKLSNVSFIDGNITGVCTADQAGSGTGSSAPALVETWKMEQEFCTASASVFDPFLGTAIASGTIAAASGDLVHPCIIGLRDSTTCGGGYRITTDATAFLLAGNEKATFIFRQNVIKDNVTYRMGFFDTVSQINPVDGCYFNVNITNATATGTITNNLTGRCNANSLMTQTATSIGVTNMQWYTAIMQMNPTASEAKFSLYDLTGSTLWEDTIISNIPNQAGRETGFGVIATQNSTDAATDIIQLDYMKLQIFNRTLIVRQAYSNNATIKLSTDFLTATASSLDPFLGTAVSSGTMLANTGSATHPGVANFTDSTTANGGYRVTTDATSFLISGNETASFIFRLPDGGKNTSKTIFGFFDTTAVQTSATDGCYLIINSTFSSASNLSAMGLCRSNNVQTVTTTNISLHPYVRTWLWSNISVNPAASVVTFTINNESQTLWSNTIATNIPTAAGRETGFGMMTGEQTTSAAIKLLEMDYMELIIRRGVNR